MSRSTKKGPYVLPSLYKKVEAMNEAGKKSVVKTWSRSSTIFPEFVGHTANSPATAAARPLVNKRGGTSNGSTGNSSLRPH